MSSITQITLSGFVQPEQTLTYLHLPFTVPEGIARLEVAYDYSDDIGSDPHLQGGNTVDIGIFDPRGVDFMPPETRDSGFRGWSGSARRSFFLGQTEATPGYLPGPIQAGTWHICLGLYKVAATGCHYTVTIRLETVEPVEPVNEGTPAARAAPQSESIQFPALLPLHTAPSSALYNPDGWYKGELHCHTHNSDGDADPESLVRLAESLNLDFLAVTDHNVRTQQIVLNALATNLILIPGYEVTTYKGHWNIWGDGDWIDFRILSEMQMQEAIEAAVARGYLVSCNHPRPYGPPWEFKAVAGYHCIEVWNGPWALFNQAALDFWVERLETGERIVAVGGSDMHFLSRDHPAKLGQPTTWIYCPGPPSAAALLAALRAGHAFITERPDGPQLYLTSGQAMVGDRVSRPADNRLPLVIRVMNGLDMTLEVCGGQGVMADYPIVGEDQTFDLTLDIAGTSYVRAQLVTRSGDQALMHTLTNPIYL